MKKVFYILGLGTLGTALYLYVKKQLELALAYEYDISKWRIDTLNQDEVNGELVISLTNKSAFSIEILTYDLNLYYKDVSISRAVSTQTVQITPNSSVDVPLLVSIKFATVEKTLLPFFLNVLQQKPVNVSVVGYVKVKFMGFTHTIDFNKDAFQYSADVLKDYGLADNWQKLKDKYSILKNI